MRSVFDSKINSVVNTGGLYIQLPGLPNFRENYIFTITERTAENDSLASTYEFLLVFCSVSSKFISFNFFVCIETTAAAAAEHCK